MLIFTFHWSPLFKLDVQYIIIVIEPDDIFNMELRMLIFGRVFIKLFIS